MCNLVICGFLSITFSGLFYIYFSIIVLIQNCIYISTVLSLEECNLSVIKTANV